MITVCSEFEKRLDRAWYELQRAIERQYEHSISQKDLDVLAIDCLESLAKDVAKRIECNCYKRVAFCPIHGQIG